MKIEQALSSENLEGTLDALQTQLPEKEGSDPSEWIITEIEDQVWKLITGESAAAKERVPYNQLRMAEYEEFIGYKDQADSQDDSERLPWWFRSFDWKFESLGQPAVKIQNGADKIEQLGDFDPEKTDVYRPKYNPNNIRRSLKKLLSGLNALKNELIQSADVDQSQRTVYRAGKKHPELPSHVFELSSTHPVVTTTGEFEQWLKSLLSLCPPYNETTTALTWYNLGLPRDVTERVLGDDVSVLNQAGLNSNNDRIINREYRDAFADIMAFQGVFDWTVEAETPLESQLDRGLEAAYIGSWLSNRSRLDPDESDAIETAHEYGVNTDDQGNEMEYAAYCVTLPISYHGKDRYRLTFDTEKRKNNGYIYHYNDQRQRAEKILASLKQANYLTDPNE